MDADPAGELADGVQVRVDWVKEITVKGKKKMRAHICEPKFGWSSMSLLFCRSEDDENCGMCSRCLRFGGLSRFEQMRPSLRDVYKEITKSDYVENNPGKPIRALDFAAMDMTKEMLIKAERMNPESKIFEHIDGDGNPECYNGKFDLNEWEAWLKFKFGEKGKCGSTWLTTYLIHMAKSLKLKPPAEETAEERLKEVNEAEAERAEIAEHDLSICQKYFFVYRPRKGTADLLESGDPNAKVVASVPHQARCLVDKIEHFVADDYCESVTEMAHLKYIADDEAATVTEGWLDMQYTFCESTTCGTCQSCERKDFDRITQRNILVQRSCIYEFGSVLSLGANASFTVLDPNETGFIMLTASQLIDSEIVGEVNAGTKIIIDRVIEIDVNNGKSFKIRAHICGGNWRNEGRDDQVLGWADIDRFTCDSGGCDFCPSCDNHESLLQVTMNKKNSLLKGDVKDRFATLKKDGAQKRLESENESLRERISILEDELGAAHDSAHGASKSGKAKAGWGKVKETHLSAALQKKIAELEIQLKNEQDEHTVDTHSADEEIEALKAELDSAGGFDQEMLDKEIELATAKLEAQLRKLKEQHNAELMQVKYEAKHTKWTLENELQQVKDASVLHSLAEYERLRGPSPEELKMKVMLETKHHKSMHGMEMKVEEWKGRLQAEERARCSMMMLFDKERRDMLVNLERQEIEKQELEARLAEMETRVKSLLHHMLESRDPDKMLAAKQHETKVEAEDRLDTPASNSWNKRMLAAKMVEAESLLEADAKTFGWSERMLKAKIAEAEEKLLEEASDHDSLLTQHEDTQQVAASSAWKKRMLVAKIAESEDKLEADAQHFGWSKRMLTAKMAQEEERIIAESQSPSWSRKMIATKIARDEMLTDEDLAEAAVPGFASQVIASRAAQEDQAFGKMAASGAWSKNLLDARRAGAEEQLEQQARSAGWSRRMLASKKAEIDERLAVQEESSPAMNKMKLAARMAEKEAELEGEAKANGWSPRLLGAKIAQAEEELEMEAKTPGWSSRLLASKVTIADDDLDQTSIEQGWSARMLASKKTDVEGKLEQEAVSSAWSKRMMAARAGRSP